MNESTQNRLRNIAGGVLIALGVVVTFVCGICFINTAGDAITSLPCMQRNYSPSAHPNNASIGTILLFLLGTIIGIILVKLARRVMIPKRLRELQEQKELRAGKK